MKAFSVFTHFKFTELTMLSNTTAGLVKEGIILQIHINKYMWKLVSEILLISEYY